MNEATPTQLRVRELRRALDGADAEAIIALVIAPEHATNLQAAAEAGLTVLLNIRVDPPDPGSPVVKLRVSEPIGDNS